MKHIFLFTFIFFLYSCDNNCEVKKINQSLNVEILSVHDNMYNIIMSINGQNYLKSIDKSLVEINTNKNNIIDVEYEASLCDGVFHMISDTVSIIKLYSNF